MTHKHSRRSSGGFKFLNRAKEATKGFLNNGMKNRLNLDYTVFNKLIDDYQKEVIKIIDNKDHLERTIAVPEILNIINSLKLRYKSDKYSKDEIKQDIDKMLKELNKSIDTNLSDFKERNKEVYKLMNIFSYKAQNTRSGFTGYVSENGYKDKGEYEGAINTLKIEIDHTLYSLKQYRYLLNKLDYLKEATNYFKLINYDI